MSSGEEEELGDRSSQLGRVACVLLYHEDVSQ